jgi:hypothetical protein
VLATLIHQTRHHFMTVKYPGTADGHNLVLSYLPGRAPKPAVAPPPKAKPLEVKSKLALKQEPEKIAPTATSPNRDSPQSEHPDAASGADALGSGNITIALAKFFPRPRPDLSSLPEGTRGAPSTTSSSPPCASGPSPPPAATANPSPASRSSTSTTRRRRATALADKQVFTM